MKKSKMEIIEQAKVRAKNSGQPEILVSDTGLRYLINERGELDSVEIKSARGVLFESVLLGCLVTPFNTER
jgi:hypothetical protein